MKLIYLLILSTLSLNIFAGNSNLAKNFAATLLQKNDLIIALISSEEINSFNHPNMFEQSLYFKNPNWLEYMTANYPISNFIIVKESFSKKHLGNFVFLKDYNLGLDDSKKISPVLVTRNSLWLVLLESMYDEVGNLKMDLRGEDIFYKGLEKFSFINFINFFKIKIPQTDNAISIKWESRFDLKTLPKNMSSSNEELLVDIRSLSKLFCDKKENLFTTENLELLTKTIPELKSEEGKKIAEAMISIIEDEIIKVELPQSVEKATIVRESPSKNKILELEKKLNLNAFSLLEKKEFFRLQAMFISRIITDTYLNDAEKNLDFIYLVDAVLFYTEHNFISNFIKEDNELGSINQAPDQIDGTGAVMVGMSPDSPSLTEKEKIAYKKKRELSKNYFKEREKQMPISSFYDSCKEELTNYIQKQLNNDKITEKEINNLLEKYNFHKKIIKN